MITMTLKDGTQIEFEGLNGTNLIVPGKQEMDVSVFTDENLEFCTFTSEDGTQTEFAHLGFVQQQKQQNGDYYICFYEKTEQQVKMDEMYELLVDLAEIEVDSGTLELESIPSGIQDAVRVKLDDSMWKDK